MQTDPQPDRTPVTGRQRTIVIALDRLILSLSRHWALALTALVGLYAWVPFVAPVAMETGATGLADVIYTVYSPVCHQFAFRSWFLFGEQTVYPRERAAIPGTLSFEQVAASEPAFSGLDVTTLDGQMSLAAKAFRGSERLGWKVAFCQRDVAIYTAIALFGIVFAILSSRGVVLPRMSMWAYLLLAIAPMGLDGFSQFFANPPFNGFGLAFYPVRESTPLLRVVTGALFGIGNAWLAYPYIEESMRDTRRLLEEKLTRAGVLRAS